MVRVRERELERAVTAGAGVRGGPRVASLALGREWRFASLARVRGRFASLAPRGHRRELGLGRGVAAVGVLLFVLAGAARGAGDPKVVPGKWSKRDVPKGWVVVETKHYQIQSEVGEATAKALGEHIEGMLGVYAEFLPTRRKLEEFVLKVFRDKAGFCAYSGFEKDTGTVAYYNQGSKELVGYDCGYVLGKRTTPPLLSLKPAAAGKLAEADRAQLAELFDRATDAYTFDLAAVLGHEGWHQYFHFYTVSWVSMPSWLDEGIGDWFFMAVRDGQAGTESGFRIGDLNSYRLRVVRRALEDGATVPFGRLMEFEQQDYYSNASVYYAQGWSMVHFLLRNDDPARRDLIPKLIRDFKDSKNFRKSTDKVFRKQDLDALDRDWIGWVITRPYADPLLDAVRAFGDRVTADDLAGEARLVKVWTWYAEHPGFPGGA